MQLHFSITTILNQKYSLLCMVLKVLYFGYSPNRVWPKFVKKLPFYTITYLQNCIFPENKNW